ncbi:MAG: DUF1015 domain-containing protein [Acidimicrobiia bacterium]
MPDFLPLPRLRYVARGGDGDISAVCAPPYDVIDPDERAALHERDPHNAIRLILPDSYTGAAEALAQWQRDGVLVLDDTASFSVYRMHFTGDDGTAQTTTGVLGALALENADGGIMPHERTLPKAKSDRLQLLRATRANLDPIWGITLFPGFTALLAVDGPPHAVATDDDGNLHELWRVDDPAKIAAIRDAVAAHELVLADGHHRFETGGNYRRERAEAGVTDPGADGIMCLVVELAPEELCVRAIHRLLHGVGTLDLRAAAEPMFTVTDLGANTPEGVAALEAAMREQGGLGLVDRAGLALLVPRPVLDDAMAHEPVELRDVDSARFDAGLRPALEAAGVTLTYRNDGATCAAHVEKGVADASVLLRPVSVDTIRAAAEARLRMPEKTTFFAPKPRTGMVFRDLDRP